jgi:hypothetical protein
VTVPGRRRVRAGPRRQRGWIGLVVLLVALLIVAMLGRRILAEMGLAGRGDPVERTAPGPSAAQPSAARTDEGAATPVPRSPLDKARGVEESLQRESAERAKRMEEGAR